MKDADALDAARRNVSDAIDSLDELNRQTTTTTVAVALLTGAGIALDVASAVDEEKDGS